LALSFVTGVVNAILFVALVGVDNGGLDPLGTLALFAMVEMILFDDIVVLCFCCDVCSCVVVEERFAFGVKDCCQVEFYVTCHQRAGVGRKLVSKLNACERKFNRRKKIFDLPKIQ
jgi:hypothetical protein